MTRPTVRLGVRLGDDVDVVIEVARFSFVKRRPDGRVHFVSPFPSPFHYGSVPNTLAPDGDPLDALVLVPGLRRGSEVRGRVLGIVRFVDAGVLDWKLVVGRGSLRRHQRIQVEGFFRVYARAKRWLDPGARAPSRFEGWSVAVDGASG